MTRWGLRPLRQRDVADHSAFEPLWNIVCPFIPKLLNLKTNGPRQCLTIPRQQGDLRELRPLYYGV
jgi:hypothetical protein